MPYISTFMALAAVHFLALLVHEVGHFLAARHFGVRVLGVSLGFGREIIGFSDPRGTRWSLAAIPLGSSIKMVDDKPSKPSAFELEQRPVGQQSQSLSSCTRGQRAIIFAAGSAANFLSTPLIYVLAQLYFVGRIGWWNSSDLDSIMALMLGSYGLVFGLNDLLPLPLHSGGKLALLCVEWLRETHGSLLRELENLAAPRVAMMSAFHHFKKRLSAFSSGNGGSTAVTTAIILPVVIGFIGLGIDTANWYTNHRQLDRIVEAAAAAAMPYLLSNPAEAQAVAQNVAALNGLSTSSGDTILAVPGPDPTNPNPTTLTVTATRPLTRYFSALFLSSDPTTASFMVGIPSSGSSSSGSSGSGSSGSGSSGSGSSGSGITSSGSPSSGSPSPGNPVCILVTAPSGSGTLQVQSGASFNAPGCEIDVASTDPGAAVFNGSLPSVGKVCVAGGSTLYNGSTVNNLTNNCPAESDPYPSILPTPTIPSSCLVDGKDYSRTVTLSPGLYCGHFNWDGPGTLNLNPGVYILGPGVDWSLSESWTINGSGVTFYFVDSGSYLDINGQATVNLTPPTSGTYANILMFEAPGLSTGTAGCTGDGCFGLTARTTGNVMQGLLYLPSRNLYLQSTGFTSPGLTLVANTVTFYKTMSWTIGPQAMFLQ